MCFVRPDAFLNQRPQYLHFTEVGGSLCFRHCLRELPEDKAMKPESEKSVQVEQQQNGHSNAELEYCRRNSPNHTSARCLERNN